MTFISKKIEIKLTILFSLTIFTIEYPWFAFLLIFYIAHLFGLGLVHILTINKFKYWKFKDKAKLITFFYLLLIISLDIFPRESLIYKLSTWLLNISTLTLIYVLIKTFVTMIKSFISAPFHYNNDSLTDIDKLTGIEFEELLYHLYTKQGYFVKLTPQSGDFGADLILQKGNQKIVVQAKRSSSKVGVEAVNEVLGGAGYYKANNKWVITNNYYTDNAIVQAYKNNVNLFDRDDLLLMLREYKNAHKTIVKSRRSSKV
ncbi:MAG TPA: restriction endonuclease [Bacillus sp. (in: firmicutes)]|nr:restriction endonuclease [Bacillus sp. (in: firmicutes)]